MRALVGEVMRMMALRGHEKGLDVLVEVATEVPALVTGDPNRLRQVLINLAGNAVKFTHEGGVVVTIVCDAGWKYLSSGAWTDDLEEVVKSALGNRLECLPADSPETVDPDAVRHQSLPGTAGSDQIAPRSEIN